MSGNKGLVKAPFVKDKRFTKKYAKELIEFVNNVISEDERGLYKELVKSIVEENCLDKPQDLLLLDTAVYDFLRLKRVQRVLLEEGDVTVNVSKSGNRYVSVNKAGYLLNAIESQLRQTLRELGLSRKERMRQELGVDKKDFASFMSEPVEAEVVKEGKNDKEE